MLRQSKLLLVFPIALILLQAASLVDFITFKGYRSQPFEAVISQRRDQKPPPSPSSCNPDTDRNCRIESSKPKS